jgi:hypothetical protein
VSQAKPFYADHAEAYDLLVTDPVDPWVEAVHERLLQSALSPRPDGVSNYMSDNGH